MRAIMVSVDYTDLLSITLPYNRHHFDEVYVVTSLKDATNVAPVCDASDARCLATDLFYANGADFNKWAALEWGLDVMGRHGWLCLMDADVLWPKELVFWDPAEPRSEGEWMAAVERVEVKDRTKMEIGNLYTPLRRMMPLDHLSKLSTLVRGYSGVPPENEWRKYPIHRNVAEWAGYSQIFHADDPVLGPPPWHQVDWKHAGGADSFFQDKWPREKKVRPPFEVLHLGEAGVNWYGRVSQRLDGTRPEESAERLSKVSQIWRGRRGKSGPDKFKGERL